MKKRKGEMEDVIQAFLFLILFVCLAAFFTSLSIEDKNKNVISIIRENENQIRCINAYENTVVFEGVKNKERGKIVFNNLRTVVVPGDVWQMNIKNQYVIEFEKLLN